MGAKAPTLSIPRLKSPTPNIIGSSFGEDDVSGKQQVSGAQNPAR